MVRANVKKISVFQLCGAFLLVLICGLCWHGTSNRAMNPASLGEVRSSQPSIVSAPLADRAAPRLEAKDTSSRPLRIELGSASPAIKVAPVALAPASSSAASAFRSGMQSQRLDLPLSFEPNRGQVESATRFVGRSGGYEIHFQPSRAEVLIPQASTSNLRADEKRPGPKRVGIDVVGADQNVAVEPAQLLPGKSSYFIGTDRSRWVTDLPTYGQLQYRQVYRGIDLVFYGNRGHLEYDFIVSPGAKTDDIALGFSASAKLTVAQSGQLDVDVDGASLHLLKPVVYQFDGTENAKRTLIAGDYRLVSDGSRSVVKFEVGAYDHSKPLIIDPVLSYSTEVTVPGNIAAITADAAGNVYVASNTSYSAVTKIAPDGKTVLYTAGLGVSYSGNITGIAVDANGRAYISGYIGTGFPTTANAYRQAVAGSTHALLAVLNPNGDGLVYSSYFPGSNYEYAYRVSVDAQGMAYLAGQTYSLDFPNTSGSNFASGDAAFILKVDPSQSGDASLVYSTVIPPVYNAAAVAVAIDANHNAYAAINANSLQPTAGAYSFNATNYSSGGVYVAKLDATGAVSYVAYMGYGEVRDLAIDGSGNAYITGRADNADYPATTGAYQTTYPYGFVSKLNPSGTALVYSTFLSGPSGAVEPESIAVQPGCSSNCPVYISGATTATDFPTINAIQNTPSGASDIFVVGLSGDGSSAQFSTYLGGNSTDDAGRGSVFHIPSLALDAAGNIYVGSNAYSADFPFTSPSAGNSPVLVKISPANAAALVASPGGFNYGAKTIGVGFPQPIVLKNYGSATLTISNITATGDFSQTNTCGGSIAPGSSCTMQAILTPSLSGSRLGSITVTHSGNNSPTTISLQGSGADQAYLTLAPQNLQFGNQPVNTTSNPMSFTVTNTGSQAAPINSFFVSNGLFAQTNDCPALLAKGAMCTVNVTFSPISVGAFSGYVSISASNTAFNGNYYVNLFGTGSGTGTSAVSVTPADANFVDQVVGTTSSYQVIYMYNVGSAPIQTSASTVTGDFVLQGDACGSLVQPGSYCYALIDFKPTAAGTRTGTLTFNNSFANQTVNLTGNGINPTPGLSISPMTMQFSDQVVGTTSPYQLIQVMNVGNSSIDITRQFTNTADFHVYYNGCFTTLAPLSSCSIYVQFTPTTSGTRTDSVTLIDDAPGSPQSIALSGNGLNPTESVYITPQTSAFNQTVVGTQSNGEYVYIYNPGNTAVTVSSVSSDSPEFVVAANGCTSIPAQSYCYVYMYFKPTSVGSKSATVSFVDSAPGSPHQAVFTGESIASTQSVIPMPGVMNFGDQVIGTNSQQQAIYIYNTGTTNVSVSNVAASGDFILAYNGCSTIYAGSYCQVNAQFAPTTSGLRTGTITLYDNAPGAPHAVQLTGNGLTADAEMVPSPSSLGFLNQVVGTTSNIQAITFYNTGNAAVTVTSVTASGDFSLNYNGCSSSVAPGSSCLIYVQFTPSAPGTRTGSVTMVDSAPGSPHGASLTGVGLAASKTLSFSANSIDFGNVATSTTSPAQGVWMYNSGTQNVVISSVVPSAGFNASGCVTTLSPNSSCQISTSFAPSTTGAGSGTITITDDATGSPHVINLTGNGVSGTPAISLSPNGSAFQPRLVGTTSSANGITFLNRSGATVLVSGVVASGDFAISNNNCTSVANNSSCSVSVTTTPTASGARSGTLTFTHNGPGSPTVIAVSALGITSNKTAVATPAGLAFLDQVLNTSSNAISTTLYNTGTAPLTLGATTITGDFSIQSTNCTGTVGAGSSCFVSVKFQPTTLGARTGQLTINDDSSTGPHVLNLTGTGVAATNLLTASVSQLNFTDQPVGTLSSVQTIALENSGTVPVTFGAFTVTGDFNMNYNGCSTSLSAGGTCYVQVRFTPTAAGALAGSIVFNSNSSSGPLSVVLNGNGLAATKIVVMSASALQYQDQPVGTTSSTQLVYVYNQGTVNVNIASAPVATGDFSVTYNGCGAAISPGSYCYFYVAFTPTQPGIRTGTISVTDDSTTGPHSVSLLGSGVAVQKSARLSATSFSFGTQATGTTSPAQLVYLYNTGNVPLDLSSVAFSGDFSTTSSACSVGTIAVNSYCYMYVVFTPTAVGTRTGSLTFVDGAPTSPQVVTLTGVGQNSQASISISTSALVFGNQEVNTTFSQQSVTITNLSNIPITFSSVTSNNPEFTISNGCSSFSYVGQTCSISVQFKPTATGPRTGALQITSNANGSPASVGLSGTGVAAGQGPTLSQTNIPFGNQGLNTTSSGVSVYYVNYGQATVTTGKGTLVGDFLQDGGCDNTSFGHNGYCVVTFRFKPTTLGPISGTFTLTDNTTGSPRVINLSGTGMSLSPALSTFPVALSFPTQVVGIASGTQTVTVYNTGNGPMTVSSIVPSPTGEFAVSSNGCATMAANSSCGFNVNFTPSATGNRSANITITDNAAGSPHVIPVSGTGIASAPIVSLSTASMSFGNTATGATSTPQGVTVFNSGNAVLTISSITPSAEFNASGGTCGSLLNPNSNCTINVTFSPTALGTRTGVLTISDSATGSPHLVSLTGSAIPPSGVQVNPSGLIFPNQVVSTVSNAQNVQILSTGALVNIASVTATGDFTQTSSCTTLGYNNTCNVSVKFNPTTVGQRTGTLTVVDDAPGSPHVISLAGMGSGNPAVQLAPTSLTFTSTDKGVTSSAQTITLTNNGSGPLALSTISASGDFAETNNCGVNLNAGLSCAINVTFTPTTFGARTGTLSITDNATGSPHTAALNGTGVAPSSSVSPTSLTFTSQTVNTTSAAQPVTLQNVGNTTLTISAVNVSGADFAQTNNCTTLAANATCTVNVTFTPQAAGARSGTLSIINNGGNQSLNLSGTGTGPVATVDKTSLAYGSVNLNTSSPAQVVKLTSAGDAGLAISSISTSGDYTQTNDCPATLAITTTCSITVTFTPAASGARNGSLTIVDNAANSPQLVTLSGSGFGPSVGFNPSSLSFGGQAVGATSSAQTITITNNGTSNLAITNIAATGDFAQTNNCPATVAPSASCTASVTFTPTAIGSRGGLLTVTSNSGTQSAGLSGTGINQGLSFAPNAVSFGSIPISLPTQPQSILVTAIGNLPTNISAISASGDFTQTNNCPATLQPAAVCTINVTFTPSVLGLRTGNVIVTSDAPVSPQTVPLNGTGTPPQADLNLSGSANPVKAPLGSNVTFNIVLANAGPSPATGVTLTMTAPANVTVNGITPSSGSCTGTGPYNCNFGTVPAGTAVTVTLNATNIALGPMVTNVNVSANENDPNMANNVAVLASTAATADLRVVPAITPTQLAGAPAYTMALANDGPSTATNVVMTYNLERFGYVNYTASQGSCSYNGVTVSCALGTMAAGSTATMTLAIQAPSSGWATIDCAATSDQVDPNPNNNIAQLSPVPDGSNTKIGSNVDVSIIDPQTGSVADVLFNTVIRPGATTLASAQAAAPPAGFRTGSSNGAVALNTTAQFNGNVTVALRYAPSAYHHPALARLFHAENGGWVDRTAAVNPSAGTIAGTAASLAQFAVFEPLDQAPAANAGGARVLPGAAMAGTNVQLDGSASSDAEGDTLTYRWTGPFPEGNGTVTGAKPNVTLPFGNSQVTLTVNDGEMDSAPVATTITVSDFDVNPSVANLSVTRGSSVTANLALSSKYGSFDRPVTLGCANLPVGMTCQFSTTTATPGASGNNVVLTITSSALASARTTSARGLLAWALAFAMPFGWVQIAGKRRRMLRKLMLLGVLLIALYQVGCGGGGSGFQSSAPPPVNNGTASVITVTAASGGLQHNTALTVTVH